MTQQELKDVVRRFNLEVIERGDRMAFEALMRPDFINRTAPSGMEDGPESMWNTFAKVLRPALSDIRVIIHDQVSEGAKVTTRKTICGRHTDTLLGVAPTGREVAIDAIDIVRVEDGRYAEHWGVNTLQAVLASLRA